MNVFHESPKSHSKTAFITTKNCAMKSLKHTNRNQKPYSHTIVADFFFLSLLLNIFKYFLFQVSVQVPSPHCQWSTYGRCKWRHSLHRRAHPLSRCSHCALNLWWIPPSTAAVAPWLIFLHSRLPRSRWQSLPSIRIPESNVTSALLFLYPLHRMSTSTSPILNEMIGCNTDSIGMKELAALLREAVKMKSWTYRWRIKKRCSSDSAKR